MAVNSEKAGRQTEVDRRTRDLHAQMAAASLWGGQLHGNLTKNQEKTRAGGSRLARLGAAPLTTFTRCMRPFCRESSERQAVSPGALAGATCVDAAMALQLALGLAEAPSHSVTLEHPRLRELKEGRPDASACALGRHTHRHTREGH